jgi:hypothetical protein
VLGRGILEKQAALLGGRIPPMPKLRSLRPRKLEVTVSPRYTNPPTAEGRRVDEQTLRFSIAGNEFEILALPGVARRLNSAQAGAIQLFTERTLKGHEFGRVWIVMESDLAKYVEGGRSERNSAPPASTRRALDSRPRATIRRRGGLEIRLRWPLSQTPVRQLGRVPHTRRRNLRGLLAAENGRVATRRATDSDGDSGAGRDRAGRVLNSVRTLELANEAYFLYVRQNSMERA